MSEAATVVAFLDASVRYPALMRNMLMHFAVNDLYQPRWSAPAPSPRNYGHHVIA